MVLTKNKIIPFPNYIKIDVDGIEHLILEGGIKTLNNGEIKSVLIEINDSFSEQHKACIEIMNLSGFKLYRKEHSSMFDNTKYKKVFGNPKFDSKEAVFKSIEWYMKVHVDNFDPWNLSINEAKLFIENYC